MLRNRDLEDPQLRGKLERFADIAEPDSPLNAILARAAATDLVCLEILGAAPASLPPANILLAAVQYLLMLGADPALAAYYPSIEGARSNGDPVPRFLDFCAEHRNRLTELVATRGVQTNEVRRCVGLMPAFATIVEAENRPLALVEVGASAGLNLCFDRYRYDYGFAGVGPLGSPLVLDTEVRGGRPPVPPVLPEVVWRVGIDLAPVDLSDPDAVRWMKALLWPDQPDRIARFEAAVDLVSPDPPRLVTGDAADGVGSLTLEAPTDASLVVFHSFVLNQFTEDQRQAMDTALGAASKERTIHEVAIAGRRERLDFPQVVHTTHRGGASTETVLGRLQHHGAWIDWDS